MSHAASASQSNEANQTASKHFRAATKFVAAHLEPQSAARSGSIVPARNATGSRVPRLRLKRNLICSARSGASRGSILKFSPLVWNPFRIGSFRSLGLNYLRMEATTWASRFSAMFPTPSAAAGTTLHVARHALSTVKIGFPPCPPSPLPNPACTTVGPAARQSRYEKHSAGRSAGSKQRRSLEATENQKTCRARFNGRSEEH